MATGNDDIMVRDLNYFLNCKLANYCSKNKFKKSIVIIFRTQ